MSRGFFCKNVLVLTKDIVCCKLSLNFDHSGLSLNFPLQNVIKVEILTWIKCFSLQIRVSDGRRLKTKQMKMLIFITQVTKF